LEGSWSAQKAQHPPKFVQASTANVNLHENQVNTWAAFATGTPLNTFRAQMGPTRAGLRTADAWLAIVKADILRI